MAQAIPRESSYLTVTMCARRVATFRPATYHANVVTLGYLVPGVSQPI